MTGQHLSESFTRETQSGSGLEDRIVRANQVTGEWSFHASQGGMTFACTRLDDGSWIVTYRDGFGSVTLTEQPVHILLAVEMMLAAVTERRRHAA